MTEEGRFCVSADGGKTWSKIQTIDAGSQTDDVAISHGVFLSHRGTLWAFLGSFYGTRKNVHTRCYTLNEETKTWQYRGVAIKDGFWPMTEPVKLKNGNWMMAGLIVGNGNPAAVAFSNGNDFTRWTTKIIDGKQVRRMWGESSIIVDGSKILNIARYGAKPVALVSESKDYGETWTPSTESNFPMATSKPYSGVLSNGQRYLICSTTADGGSRRTPLTIAMSRTGESQFSEVFVIRHAVVKEGPGESNPNASLSYPYAIECNNKLYVGYSNDGGRGKNHNSAELAVIPIEQLMVK